MANKVKKPKVRVVIPMNTSQRKHSSKKDYSKNDRRKNKVREY